MYKMPCACHGRLGQGFWSLLIKKVDKQHVTPSSTRAFECNHPVGDPNSLNLGFAACGLWAASRRLQNGSCRSASYPPAAGAQAVWLLGGAQEDADALVQRVPALQGPPRKALRLPLAPLAAAYVDWLRLPSGSPSTGFVGIAAVLHCAAPGAVAHLYGMNWHEKNWRGHKMGAERAHWAPAEAAGRLVVHPTPCHGMRECGQARPHLPPVPCP